MVFNTFIYFQSTYDLILFYFKLVMILLLIYTYISWGFMTVILTMVFILNSLFQLTFLLDYHMKCK